MQIKYHRSITSSNCSICGLLGDISTIFSRLNIPKVLVAYISDMAWCLGSAFGCVFSLSLLNLFYFVSFFCLHPRHMKFPRPGIEPASEQPSKPLQLYHQTLNMLSHQWTPWIYFNRGRSHFLKLFIETYSRFLLLFFRFITVWKIKEVEFSCSNFAGIHNLSKATLLNE